MTDVILPDFSAPLLAWYDRCRRPLPWRLQPTPYRVWVSEIMLQQTRVEAVKPYFVNFIAHLPDVASLAACPPDTLHKLWEGLGYYSRVRNLQKAAQTVLRDFGGIIPSDPAALLTLPGIGSYTAGAIAAFAYGIPAAAVDGNVLRVLARVLGDGRNILDPAVKRTYEAAVRAALPADRPGDYGQALIEIGATVCVPNQSPRCGECPIAGVCVALRDGKTADLPVREKKKTRRMQEKTVLLICDGSHTLLHRRPAEGLLAGLYEFPSLPGFVTEDDAVVAVRSLGLEPTRLTALPDARHVFTHIEWRMHGYRVAVADAALPANTPLSTVPCVMPDASSLPGFPAVKNALVPSVDGDYVFADTSALTDVYPIPSAFAAFLSALHIEKGSLRMKRTKTAD